MDQDYGLHACLDRMAERVDNAEQSYDDVPDGRGWGQFLDGPKDHRQVGPYGVCSGVIVRSLAGREHKGPEQTALHVLFELYQRHEAGNPRERKYFAQTLRLAYLCLALRLAGSSAADVAERAQEELLARVLPNGSWGDWWIDNRNYDQTPSVFVTSIVLLCLLLFARNGGGGRANALQQSVEYLAQKLVEVPEWSPLPAAAALAALAAARCKRAAVTKQANSLLGAQATVTSDLGVYFYDFQFLGEGGALSHSRDYFIIPIELLIVIVGLLPGARVNARLHALTTIDGVKSIVIRNEGAYRSSPEQRLSTKNQAWAAIALKLATYDLDPPLKGQRLLWNLTKPRANRYVDKWMPPLALLFTTALAALSPANATPTNRVFRALALLVIGGLYAAPATFRQLIRGRA